MPWGSKLEMIQNTNHFYAIAWQLQELVRYKKLVKFKNCKETVVGQISISFGSNKDLDCIESAAARDWGRDV